MARGMRAGTLGTAAVLAALLVSSGSAAAAQAPRGFYGVVPQADIHAPDLERMGAGQVGTVRVTLPWQEIDPTPVPGDYLWHEFDQVVAGASREQITVLPTIYTVPGWLARLEGCDDPAGGPCSITPPTTQFGLSQWRSFIAAAVRRYGPEGLFWTLNRDLPERPIRAWQIWNEPNSSGFYQPSPSIDRYADLLVAASESIRSIDPDASVLLGGLYREGAIDATDFLRGLYARPGIEAAFDGVAIHPYAGRMSGVKGQVRRINRVIKSAGDDQVRIWITEIGWASGGRRTPLNRGPRGQAKRLEQAFRWFTAKRKPLGIELVAWYAWRDVPLDEFRCRWCARTGLFPTHSLEPKPAWARFVAFTGGR